MKRNILLINLAAFFFWMAMFTYTPVLPSYAASLGAGAVMIGVIGGAYGLLQILLRVPLGVLSDKLKKDKLMLAIGFVVLLLSTLLFIVADSVAMLVAARGMAGASAAWWVILCASYARYHGETKQVKAQGVISAVANFGKVAAAVVGAAVAQTISYHGTFIAAFIAAGAALVTVFFLKKQDMPRTATVPLRQQFALLKNRDLLSVSILALLSHMLAFGAATTFTAVAAETRGANGMQLGLLSMTFFLITSVVSFFVGTKPYRQVGGVNVLAISFVIGAFSCVPAFFHAGLGAIFFAQAFSGVSWGVAQAALAGMAVKSVAAEQRGMATGIFQSIYGVGILLGPVIMGYVIANASFDAAYRMMLGIMLGSAALCYLLIPKKYGRMT